MKKIIFILFVVVGIIFLTTCTKQEQEEATLRWINYQIELNDLVLELGELYTEETPGVKIDNEILGEAYADTVRSRAAGDGFIADIFTTRGYSGMLEYSDFMMDLSNEPFVNDMVDGIKPGLSSEDGKVLGFPYQMSGWGIIYNKAIFRENNIAVPTTFEELREVSKALKAKGITPFINQFKDAWMIGHLIGTGIVNIPNYADYIKAVENGEKSLTDSPAMQRNLELFDLAIEFGQDNPLDAGWNEATTMMAQEKGAMFLEGIWVYDSIVAINPDIELGMMPVPYSNDASENTIYADFNGLWNVQKDTKYPEEAKAFLHWLYSSETAKKKFRDAGMLPAYKGYEANTHSIGEDVTRYISQSKTRPFGWLFFKGSFESDVGKAYQEYMLGSIARSEVLEAISAVVRNLK